MSWRKENDSYEAESGKEVSEKATRPKGPHGEEEKCVHSKLHRMTTKDQRDECFRRCL